MEWGGGAGATDSELAGTMHGEKRGKAARSYHNEELGSDAMGGYSLEDYIYSLESRGERVSNNNIHSDPDVYGQLQQKERDLILAAELGKALLEKNEDLSKQNEKIAEDFSQKLEELEQEKYHLRRRLEGVEEEYDLKVSELQTDISGLRNILQQTEVNQRQSEREKSLLIGQLTEQNQRLTSQLKDVSPVCSVEMMKFISKPILELTH